MAVSGYYLVAPLPKGLKGLAELALDLRWYWSHASDAFWQRVDSELWSLTRNPWLILQTIVAARHPFGDYTPRLVPCRKNAAGPHEANWTR